MVTKKSARLYQDQQRALQSKDAGQTALTPEEKALRKQKRLIDYEREKCED